MHIFGAPNCKCAQCVFTAYEVLFSPRGPPPHQTPNRTWMMKLVQAKSYYHAASILLLSCAYGPPLVRPGRDSGLRNVVSRKDDTLCLVLRPSLSYHAITTTLISIISNSHHQLAVIPRKLVLFRVFVCLSSRFALRLPLLIFGRDARSSFSLAMISKSLWSFHKDDLRPSPESF